MKKNKISILCAMIITTTTHCTETSNDQKTEAFVKKTLNLTKTFSKFDDKFIITSKRTYDSKNTNNKKLTEQLNKYSCDQENKQSLTIKETGTIVASVVLLLFLIATIKSDFFPSEEQKKLQTLKDSDVGITGLSRFSEYLIISRICDFLR